MLTGRIRLDNAQIPLHFQIGDYLMMRLGDGDLRPGDKLPSEEDLQKIFGVSRMTVRKALDNLREKGLVEKSQGKSTRWTARAFSVKREKLSGFNRYVSDVTRETKLKVLAKTQELATTEVAKALNLLPNSEVTAFRRVRFLEDAPVAFSISCLPPRIGSKILTRYLQKKTMLETLETVLKLNLSAIDYEVEVHRADQEIAENLRVQVLDPVLKIGSRIIDDHGLPVECSSNFVVENKYKFGISLPLRSI